MSTPKRRLFPRLLANRTRRMRTPLVLVALLVTLVCCGMTPVDVRDIAVSLPDVEQHAALGADPARTQLVVLQHGMLRSPWSMWRLERALEQHGYEVMNTGYPSTGGRIEDHAARLRQELESRLDARNGPRPELHFVGHSMGGLVIRCYLSQPGALPAASCVFLGTPHRGAALSRHYADDWAYQTFGGEAALQLVPGHPFYDSLCAVGARRVGCIAGAAGDGEGRSAEIPGDDDGRVGIDEAQLPEQTDGVILPIAHGRLPIEDASIAEVLHFLRRGKFGASSVERRR